MNKRRFMMMDCILKSRHVVLLAALAGVPAFVGGCDRAMFVHVNARALDPQGHPVSGRTVGVVRDCHAGWPRPRTGSGAADVFDLNMRSDAYTTDPNGVIAFDAVNFEPVCILDFFADMIFPPSIKFLIMLPDGQPSAYAVTFVPGGDYRESRFSYRHFDLRAGRTLRPTYSDASGGLDITPCTAPRDPNNPGIAPLPSLDIGILLREGASGDSPASSSVSPGN